MPEWIHNRAEHIRKKNPEMPESEAFAIATQQSHALGKSPKDYGTAEGRSTAKKKYDTPKDDVKTADPKTKEASPVLMFQLNTVTVGAFSDELQKIAGAMDWITSKAGRIVGKGLKTDAIARGHLADAVTQGVGEKMMRGPSRFLELLKGGKQVAVPGPEKLVEQPKFLGLFSRKPKMMPTIDQIRPGNVGGVYSGKVQSITPHEAQDEALKSVLARGAVGAGALYAGGKAVKALRMPPIEEDFPGQYKQANLSGMGQGTPNAPANPTGLAEIKSTIPNKPLSGKTPKYTKVHPAPTPTPAASHQPVSEPPAVRR